MNTRGRVVIVRSLLTAFGGAEHAAALNAVGLQRRGYAVTFLTRTPMDTSHPYYRMLVDAGVDVITPSQWTDRTGWRRAGLALRPLLLLPYVMVRPKRPADAWRSLAAIVDTWLHRLEERSVLGIFKSRASGPDGLIVHIYGQEYLTRLVATWAAAARVPLLYTESGEGDAAYARTFNLAGTIEVINQVPLVVCCGPRVAANIRGVYDYRGEIAEIPFLVEDPMESIPLREPGGDVVFGIIGRVVAHKGHADAIWAIAQLRAEGIPARLVVAGLGPDLERLRGVVKELGVEDAVEFAGRYGHVADIFARIDGLVLPSSSEGQPLAITESMAYGRPVVSTWFGGIPDLVTHERTGLLVEPGNRAQLVDAMRRLSRDPELRRAMGDAGRADYVARRSNAAVLDRIEAAYQRAAAGAPRPMAKAS